MLVFKERGKPEYQEKNLSEQRENKQQTQPTYEWRWVWEWNPGHIGGRRVLLTTAPPLLLLVLLSDSATKLSLQRHNEILEFAVWYVHAHVPNGQSDK